jgi:hypothetical protein
MSEEKLTILEMIQSGKLSAAEGLELLKALDDTAPKSGEIINNTSRFLRVRVTTDESNTNVNVNIPLNLLKVVSKFADIGIKFIPENARQEMSRKGINLSDINFDELIQLIDQGLVDGKLVDIDTLDEQGGRTKVEVYVE